MNWSNKKLVEKVPVFIVLCKLFVRGIFVILVIAVK